MRLLNNLQFSNVMVIIGAETQSRIKIILWHHSLNRLANRHGENMAGKILHLEMLFIIASSMRSAEWDCISGNVMIDKNHLGEPNNVILENDQQSV